MRTMLDDSLAFGCAGLGCLLAAVAIWLAGMPHTATLVAVVAAGLAVITGAHTAVALVVDWRRTGRWG